MFAKEEKKKGGEVIGIIGKGMSCEGKLVFDDTVRIEGSFKGEIDAKGTLVVGDSGYVEGQIKVGSAIITGELRGALDATTRVELRAPAKVFGDIRTPNLIISEGVTFEGNCIMVKRAERQVTPGEVDYGEDRQKEA